MKQACFLLCMLYTLSLPAGASDALSADEAKKLWEKSKDRPDYRQYLDEFAKFNNAHHLDEKDGCFSLSRGPVTIYLILEHKAGDKFAVIGQVASDVDNAKAKCFKKSYIGVPTKIPPFLPFVMALDMGG